MVSTAKLFRSELITVDLMNLYITVSAIPICSWKVKVIRFIKLKLNTSNARLG